MALADTIIEREKLQGEGRVISEGYSEEGFRDFTRAFPRQPYLGDTSVNRAVRHGGRQLETGGSEIDLGIQTGLDSQYPFTHVHETAAGHTLEYNDTPGSERIMLRHTNGSGINIGPDGSILISSSKRVDVVRGDQVLSVSGSGDISFSGNLNLNVKGDLNIDVGGTYNIKASEKSEKITGDANSSVYGNDSKIVTGNQSATVNGVNTQTQLGGLNQITKGNTSIITEGDLVAVASGSGTFTSEGKMVMSSPDVNIAGQSLSVFGNTGTIGGESIIMYSMNSHVQNSVWAQAMNADTFHGDLKGTADQAVVSDTTNSQGYPSTETGTATGMTVTNTAVDTTATALPTGALLESYLGASSNGVRRVVVDPEDGIRNAIDPTLNQGEVASIPLAETETRSRMRDQNNRSNTNFISNAVATGNLSPSYAVSSPPAIGRIRSMNTFSDRGRVPVGNAPVQRINKRIEVNRNSQQIYIPDIQYVPENFDTIDASTPLGRGIALGKFLGGEGDPVTLSHITTLEERRQIARNLLPQAEIIRRVNDDTSQFSDFNLVVVEGLYKPGVSENMEADGINELASKGRAVVYELRDTNGQVNEEKTFDLVTHMAFQYQFEKIILDYDTYDPNGSLNVQIIVVMPEIPQHYSVSFENIVHTAFNNSIQSTGELVEILLETSSGLGAIASSSPDGVSGSLPSDGSVIASNPDPNSLPKQNIIDSISLAVRTLGPGYQAQITPQGGKAARPSGTENHPVGDAADHFLVLNGTRINPSNNPNTYRTYIEILVRNAASRGIRPGIGGYPSFIHYDESSWRQGGATVAGSWNNGFDVPSIVANIRV